MPSRHLEQLYHRAAAHADTLGPEAGPAWLLGHGLLAAADHPLLADAARRNLARNLLLIHRFRSIAETLAPLPLAPLKGLHLLDTVYRHDPGSRVLSDLDLLIRPQDTAGALEVLTGLGYRETALSRRTAAQRHERVLTDGEVTVELHTRLGVQPGHRASWDELAPVPARVHDRDVQVLDAATTLVHLTAHFVKHGPFTVLRWAEDVVRWSGMVEDGGAAAVARARELGALRPLVAGVRALRRVVGDGLLAGVPGEPEGAAGRAVRWHERLVWGALRGDEPLALGAAASPWRRNLTAVLLADRAGDAVRFVLERTASFVTPAAAIG